jgi:hypothetical protein
MKTILNIILLLIGATILIPLAFTILKFLLMLIADGILYVGLVLGIAFVMIVIGNIINKKN